MNRPTFTYLCLAASIIIPSTGCFWVTTKHEGKKLRTDVNRIDGMVQRQESQLGGAVKRLKSTLDEASKLLARNSADLGAQFEGLERENARLTGLVMEAKRYTDEVFTQVQTMDKRLLEMEGRLAAIEGKTPPVGTSPDKLYDDGMRAFKANDYTGAREIFRKLIVQFPGHSRADDAQYHRGESYYVEKDYKSALKEFQAVFEKHASSPLADDALYRAGQAAEKLKWCTDARVYYSLLTKKYPKSDLAKKAKNQDAKLKRNSKNRKVCQP